jgi:hypothetical protein
VTITASFTAFSFQKLALHLRENCILLGDTAQNFGPIWSPQKKAFYTPQFAEDNKNFRNIFTIYFLLPFNRF